MVRSIASPVDGARVPSTEVQAPQPWVVIGPSVIQSRKGMRTSISLGDFRVATKGSLFWPQARSAATVSAYVTGLPEFETAGTTVLGSPIGCDKFISDVLLRCVGHEYDWMRGPADAQ
jgi:hypothetical protein